MRLTHGQLEIMNYIWSQDKAVLREDIIENATQEYWQASSFYTVMDKMIENGFIKITGYEKKKGRVFSAAVTRSEYLKTHASAISAPTTELMSAWIDKNPSVEELRAMKRLLQEKLDALGE